MIVWRVEICDWTSPLLPTTTTTDNLGCSRHAIRQVTFHFLTFRADFSPLPVHVSDSVKSSHKPSNFHLYGRNFWFTFHCYFISWPIRGRSTLYFFHPVMAFTFLPSLVLPYNLPRFLPFSPVITKVTFDVKTGFKFDSDGDRKRACYGTTSTVNKLRKNDIYQA